MSTSARINHQIKAPEVRVIGPQGENFGVLPLSEAIEKARGFELDLIEISPNANPPVAKIQNYGKYVYAENKKLRATKSKAHSVEVKSLQIKIGTGENDLALKARKATEWLSEGHRIKLDLFLPGRAKYLDPKFLEERMARFLKLISEEHRVAEPPKKSPKGMTAIIERASPKKAE